MPTKKNPLEGLKKFIPENTFELIEPFLKQYAIHLKITRPRRTKYGDYRPPRPGQTHRISINGNLNPYHFLLTLVHEIAHLVAFDKYSFKIKSHGAEWQNTYRELLQPFLAHHIFPPALLSAIKKSLVSVKSSSCYDSNLAIALRAHDEKPVGIMIQDLEIGAVFATTDNRKFELLKKRRTRYEAKEITSQRVYLFPALYEVEKL